MKSACGPIVLPTFTSALFDAAVRQAVQSLRRGELVALPTETVYGLAADARNAEAVRRVFEVKRRPAENPIIVHVAGLEMAKRCVTGWPETADDLARAFWPGPLTLVLPRARMVPDVVTAGGGTVGVRWPSHPLIQAVIRGCGFPLAAPSANAANCVSPTTAAHVVRGLGDRLDLVVDGGPCQVGIESTVLDPMRSPPRILRPGVIHEESLEAVLGVRPGTAPAESGEVFRSPGRLAKHYAPRARLLLRDWTDESVLRQIVGRLPIPASKCWVVAHTRIPSSEALAGVSVVPRDAEAFARALYAELHRCDDSGAEVILVESPPDETEWRAVRDRLNRASG